MRKFQARNVLIFKGKFMVGGTGLEPVTSAL